jgi:hypothetical protein
MDRAQIEHYLRLLGAELQQRGVTGEIMLVGGAFMVLVVGNRPATKDIDAYFATEPQAIRDAATVVAQREQLDPHWLNDAVKGFLLLATTDIAIVGRARVARTRGGTRVRASYDSCRWPAGGCRGHPGASGPPRPHRRTGRLVGCDPLHSTSQLTPRTQYLIQSLFP